MSDEWTIQKYRGKFALNYTDETGKRRRKTLSTDDKAAAQRLAPVLYAELTRPEGRKVADLWQAYTIAKKELAVIETMTHTWKALKPFFGGLDGEAVTMADCRSYTAHRRAQGRSDGTIHTELGHVRMVLLWAAKHRLIDHAPEIERPRKPAPKERYLTHAEVRSLIAAARAPHIKLAIHLLIATAARVSAILELEWERVDFARRQIRLADPEDDKPRKGRAIVPINNTLMSVLQEARMGALSEYVVEWGGQPVASIKKGVATAARFAGLDDVSPHVLRHTAAVWMAEAGRSMSEIAQYLGHSNTSQTEKVYARYSPDHLREAASALELNEINEVPLGSSEPTSANSG